MTYLDLIREADYQVDTNRITLEEYDKMIAPLRRDVDALDKIRNEISNDIHKCNNTDMAFGMQHTLDIIDKYKKGM